MNTLHVELGERGYPIYTDTHLLTNTQLLRDHIRSEQVCIVTNTTVGELYANTLVHALSGFEVGLVTLPDGEAYKNLTTLNLIFDHLLGARHNRNTTLIALGGGVVGDMTGFAAACYQRGVAFVQIPTTLLAMVDSSVGGKTGVNHALGKNMIGAFYQPQAVLADVSLLASLPARELSAGLAEVIKYALICDADFLPWLEQNIEALRAGHSDTLAYCVRRCCENKAKVVAQDEREGGIRAILNLGHTFGHAIETAQGYGHWLHGEAVGAGMVMALDLSARMGHITRAEQQRAVALIARAGLPVKAPADMTDATFIELMGVDKKVLDGRLRLVLLRGLGDAYMTCDFDPAALRETFAACR